MASRTSLLLLVICLLQGYAFAAVGITFDETGSGLWHWSGAGKFSASKDNIGDWLPSLAKQAYEEMVADFSARDIKSRRQPAVMTAFAVETDTTMVVYFASSLKGNKPFLVLPETNKPPDERVAQEVQDAILRCQQQYGPEHSNGFSCGEPLAIQTFLANNPEATVAGKGQITAYGVIGRDDSKNPVLGIKAPCESGKGDWGCQNFLAAIGVSAVGSDGDQPTSPPIDPTEQLPHCFYFQDSEE